MANWRTGVLDKIHRHAKERKVLFTLKALRELESLELGLDEVDACGILEDLGEADFSQRVLSVRTQEWLYVFKPFVADIGIYLKVVIRDACIGISFHEDETNED
jgi:hypothetical protein